VNIDEQRDQIRRFGFSKVTGFLNPYEVEILKRECAAFLNRPHRAWSEYPKIKYSREYQQVCFSGKNVTVALNIIGINGEVDKILGRVLCTSPLKELLCNLLGLGYKLWQENVRRAEAGGKGLNLHQDTPGELGIFILLTDTQDLLGTTVFLPGSHQWPVRVKETGLNALPINFFRPCLTGFTGSAGDLCLFTGQTWHGRYRPDSMKEHLAIAMSLYPVGSRFRMQKPQDSILNGLDPDLRTLLDWNNGVTHYEDGWSLITGDGQRANSFYNQDLNYINGRIPFNRFSFWSLVKLWCLLVVLRRKALKKIKNLIKICIGRPIAVEYTDY